MDQPWLIYGLPFAGLLIGFVDLRFGDHTLGANNLIIDEIHEPTKTLQKRWVPIVFLGTLVTHLFGGSAGREGTAVQMGAALSDRISNFFRVDAETRRTLLMTGMGAGFGAAIGAPWAGVIFGMEAIQIGRTSLKRWPQCLLASMVAYGVCKLIGTPHVHYFYYQESPFLGWRVTSWIFPVSVIFGLFAMGFARGTHFLSKLFKTWVPSLPLKAFLGGVILVLLYQVSNFSIYQGLGIERIQWSLMRGASLDESFLKGFFTSLTLAAGFKGGEFTPLVYMGASLGSALSSLFELPTTFFAALGFCAVFAAASNTPIACSIMAAELFGWAIFPYAMFSCVIAYLFSGHSGIYSSQPVLKKKYSLFQ